VRTTYGEAAKHVQHPVAGLIRLEYSAFAVDGRPDLGMVIYNPATPADADQIKALVTLK
jgi:MmyB-like transcription regulator ligand binding domain